MRGVVMQRKHPAIDHRVAAQTIGGTPAESFAIILPSQCPAERLWPLVMAFVGAVDLRGDRELVVPSGRHVEVDDAPILQPGICVDPKIHLVSWKVTPEKWPRHLRLQRLGGSLATGKVEVPIRPDDVSDPGAQPVAMLLV